MNRLRRFRQVPGHVREMRAVGWPWRDAVRNACSWAWGWRMQGPDGGTGR